jgi:hypothetical protein
LSHTDLDSTGQKLSKKFACFLEYLKVELMRSKKCQNPEELGILALFQICKISLVKTLTGHEMCCNFPVQMLKHGFSQCRMRNVETLCMLFESIVLTSRISQI